MDNREIFGYITGNGGKYPEIYTVDGIPVLNEYQKAHLKYFRYPDESITTYRLWKDPDWIMLPFGTIPSPSQYSTTVTVPGQIGIYLVFSPRDATKPMPKVEAYTQTISAPVFRNDERPAQQKKPRKKKDPTETEVRLREVQLQQVTTLLDVAHCDLDPLEVIKHPEFQEVSRKQLRKARRQSPQPVTIEVKYGPAEDICVSS